MEVESGLVIEIEDMACVVASEGEIDADADGGGEGMDANGLI